MADARSTGFNAEGSRSESRSCPVRRLATERVTGPSLSSEGYLKQGVGEALVPREGIIRNHRHENRCLSLIWSRKRSALVAGVRSTRSAMPHAGHRCIPRRHPTSRRRHSDRSPRMTALTRFCTAFLDHHSYILFQRKRPDGWSLMSPAKCQPTVWNAPVRSLVPSET